MKQFLVEIIYENRNKRLTRDIIHECKNLESAAKKLESVAEEVKEFRRSEKRTQYPLRSKVNVGLRLDSYAKYKYTVITLKVIDEDILKTLKILKMIKLK